MSLINKVASAPISNFEAAPEKPIGTELEDFHHFLDVVAPRVKKVGKNPKKPQSIIIRGKISWN